MGAFALAGRIGFGVQWRAVTTAVGLTLLLINIGVIADRTNRPKWYRTIAPITLAAILLPALAGFGHGGNALADLGVLLAIVGFVLFLLNLVRAANRNFLAVIFCLAFGLLLGLYSIRAFGLGFRQPLFPEAFIVGQGHPDEAFNAAIAGNIRTYGVPSLGLDGLPFASYHFGSHIWLRSVADLVGVSVFTMYSYLSAVILIPLVLYSFSICALRIRRLVYPDEEIGTFPGGLLGAFVLLLGIITPFPKTGDMIRSTLDLLFISDSYDLGLALSFLAIAAHN